VNLEGWVARAAALAGDKRWRIVCALVFFAAITVETVRIAHPTVLSGFAFFDDEGYMLVSLKAFANHGHLYDHVFTQYGPFYYEVFGGIASIFGISITNDAGREMTMVVWVAASLVFGLGIWRLTRSLLLGFGTQILCFSVLTILAGAPMHPIGLIALLLAIMVLIAGFVGERESPYAMALLGAAAAALCLVKVNVGIFAVLSVILACLVTYPTLWRHRRLRIGYEILFLAVPTLLMIGNFDESWVRTYDVNITASVLAVLVALEVRGRGERKAGDLSWLIGGFVVLAVASCAIVVASGTSIHGLWEGLIVQPLRQPGAYVNAVGFGRRFYAIDLLGLGAAVAYWFARRRREGEPGPAWYATWSIFAIAVGLTMAYSVTGWALPFDSNGLTGFQFAMAPFIWVALIATVPGEHPERSFARVLLPLLAVLQTLHAFPAAGAQMSVANLLMVPVGALCVANGVRGLSRLTAIGADRLALAGFGVVAVIVFGWFSVETFLREPLPAAQANYNGGVSLGLPGADDIHVGTPEAETYQGIVEEVDKNCSTVLMIPGLDSLYLWTEVEPPSYTAGDWENLFDTAHQEQVIEDTSSIEDLCLLRNRGNEEAAWGNGEGPLVDYLEGPAFKPIGTVGPYELLRRDKPS
jgi:hypothetical protein